MTSGRPGVESTCAGPVSQVVLRHVSSTPAATPDPRLKRPESVGRRPPAAAPEQAPGQSDAAIAETASRPRQCQATDVPAYGGRRVGSVAGLSPSRRVQCEAEPSTGASVLNVRERGAQVPTKRWTALDAIWSVAEPAVQSEAEPSTGASVLNVRERGAQVPTKRWTAREVTYRFVYCGALRARLSPYFLRSFIRGSRVSRPAWRSGRRFPSGSI